MSSFLITPSKPRHHHSSSPVTVPAAAADADAASTTTTTTHSSSEQTTILVNSSPGEFRVLCLNTYLVPPSVSWNPYFWAPFWSCRRAPERAMRIGQLARNYDLVCLQEVWGTQMNALNDAVAETHSVPRDYKSFSKIEWLNELVDPVRLFYRQVGGLWMASKDNKFKLRSLDKRHFERGGQVPFSNQNVTVTEYECLNDLKGTTLLVFNTHFSVFGGPARKQNLACVEEFVRFTLWRAYLRRLAYPSGSFYINPGNGEKCGPNVFGDICVLVLGDFNIDRQRSPRSFRSLMTLNGTASIRDLFAREQNVNFDKQHTYNTQERDRTKEKRGNSLFPWPFDGRVDYILGIDDITISSADVVRLIDRCPPELVLLPPPPARPVAEETKQRKEEEKRLSEMTVPISDDGSLTLQFKRAVCKGMDILTQSYGEELSDHWALSATLSFGEPFV